MNEHGEFLACALALYHQQTAASAGAMELDCASQAWGQGAPTTSHSPCFPPLCSRFRGIHATSGLGHPWDLHSLTSVQHQLLRGSILGQLSYLCPQAALMLRRHPVIQLGVPSRERVIMSYLGLVMTAPCHCSGSCPAQLPRTFCWEGTNLLNPDWMQFCTALSWWPQKRVPSSRGRT